MPIKITRDKFRNGEPFLPSIGAIASQTWGGRADAELMKLAGVLQDATTAHNRQRDKYIKEHGVPNDDGGFSMVGATKENVKEFDDLMESAFTVEIELPFETPIKITKRKKNNVTPFQAAAVACVIEIVWPTDDGEDLDKIDKK